MKMRIAGTLFVAATLCGAAPRTDPRAAVRELLDTDRAFAAAAEGRDLPEALAAMWADDVVMPTARADFAEGREAALAALRASPVGAGARIRWTPVRGGISADGAHGFTFGYFTAVRADGTEAPGKYMSYWVRRPEGWRVAAYKRAGRPEGEVSLEEMPPALPERMVDAAPDDARLEAHRASLDRAERDFSDEAQRIGLGPAFARWGSDDAVNMGPGAAYTVGAAAIGAGMGDAPPSPVSWAPERVLVASSGDLGVSIGWIRPNAPSADPSRPSRVPFFTIWRRAGPGAPWRYVAE